MVPRAIRSTISPLLYRLYVKRRIERTSTVRMSGLTLSVVPSVFHPGLFFSSGILASHLCRLPLQHKRVLDMGTGTGLLALCAARAGATVMAVDINPAAVDCTRHNAARNCLQDRVAVAQSDLFEGIPPERQFDYVIWNPPFYPRQPANHAMRAWHAGIGYEVLQRFSMQAARHLAPGGVLVMIFSSDMQTGTVLDYFRREGFQPELISTQRKIFETFSIYHFPRSRTS